MREQPDAQPRPALRVQPAHVRRRQPAVVDRSGGAGRPVRASPATTTAPSIRSAGAAAAHPDSVRHVGGRRLGPRADGSERRAPGAASRVSRCRSTIRAPSSAAATASSSISGRTACRRRLRATCRSSSPSRSTCPPTCGCRRCRRANILTSNATGTVGGSIMDYEYNVEYSQTWSGGLQYQLRPDDDGGSVLHGHVDARRRQRAPSTTCPSRARARSRRAGRSRS